MKNLFGMNKSYKDLRWMKVAIFKFGWMATCEILVKNELCHAWIDFGGPFLCSVFLFANCWENHCPDLEAHAVHFSFLIKCLQSLQGAIIIYFFFAFKNIKNKIKNVIVLTNSIENICYLPCVNYMLSTLCELWHYHKMREYLFGLIW